MRRTAAIATLFVMVLVPLLWTAEAWARAGGGGSSGSRGSRGFSTPASPAPMTPSRPAPTPMSPQPAPSRWGGIGGMLGGLLVGGLVWFAISYMRRRREAAAPSGYAAPDDAQRWQPSAQYGSESAVSTVTGPVDLERGLGYIRQMDPGFDPKLMADGATDTFFRIQAAWMGRDMSGVAALLTPEMQGIMQRDCDKFRAEGRINRLENIAVRSAEVTEAWQERGEDYVTVHLLASLLDFTTDESGARVLEGSRTEPVKFEEFSTFVRSVGPTAYRLSAIQQA